MAKPSKQQGKISKRKRAILDHRARIERQTRAVLEHFSHVTLARAAECRLMGLDQASFKLEQIAAKMVE
jgi:hypothetical protein